TSVVPIPYANKAQSSDVTDVASSVKVNGNGAANINSTFSQSSGDSPGDKRGIASGTNDGEAEFIMGSFNVLIEGKPAVRQGDPMISNSKNTPPAPLMQSGGPAPRGLSVQVRDLDTQSEDPAEAVYNIEAKSDETFLGQGVFKLSQGGYKKNKVLGEE
ncbi:DUF4150 domain-containing protein, partial [Pseudoalteromonas sp. SG41-2]|uniref:DUF4150 domain-containing protein n=1 Tax=Pseudoalteromonas sp. SG41-2 TaxID=2760978 RepID=UPI001602783E